MHTPGRPLLAVSLLAGWLFVGGVPAAQKDTPARRVDKARCCLDCKDHARRATAKAKVLGTAEPA